jgi:ornithine cyclodeaminase/alanine dehydrogenase
LAGQLRDIEITFLSGKETMAVGITDAQVMEIVERTLRSHSDKTIQLPSKISVHAYEGAASIAMPTYIEDMDALGCKWISDSPRNYAHDLPYITGLVVVNDPETCIPLAVMDSSWITKSRTGAVTAIAAKHLARRGSRIMGVIGAGVQGRSNSLAICRVLPDIQTIKVFDIRDEARQKYMREAEKTLDRSIDVMPVENVKEAVESSDVVITAIATTAKMSPIISTEWFKKGVFYAAIDDWSLIGLEAVSKFDKFVTDDLKQTRSFMLKESPKELPTFYAELGDIVTGKKAGRENDIERIMDNNLGLAIHDIALAKRVYELARQKGIGHRLTLDVCD